MFENDFMTICMQGCNNDPLYNLRIKSRKYNFNFEIYINFDNFIFLINIS